MKSLLQLHVSVLVDLGRQCSIDITRDRISVSERCEDEGDSYLTITLPLFAKALERALATERWPDRGTLPNWKYVRGLPAFMRGFLIRVFDQNGYLLDDPDVDCIRAIRQFCLLSQKVERECSPERIQAAFDGFIKTDNELMGLPGRIDPRMLGRFVRASHALFGDIFQECDRLVADYALIPKHGPGAVAERISQKEKRNFNYWTERLETVFPFWRYTSNSTYAQTELVAPHNELPVRVITVPKTQSTPRIIAIEPSSVQYAQQGLKRELYEMIGRGPLNKVLGFRDQSRNRDWARQASITGDFATLDLSEASDRIHWFLVYSMLKRYPHLWEFVHATRSSRADVSGYGIVPLQKFASMGSALTFPMEAIVFTTLVALGIHESGDIRKITPRHLAGRMSVYGDDIIVPVSTVGVVVKWLEHFGAKVNNNKSFWTGKFRESCGAEFYAGHDVTVVRARQELPSSRRDAANIAAFIDLRNRMFLSGMWNVVKDIDESLDSLLDVPYVHVSQEGKPGFLHRLTSVNPNVQAGRFHPDYQYEQVKAPVLIPHSNPYKIDGEPGLLEWFHTSLRQRDQKDRYDSQERPVSFSIKHRWVPKHIMLGTSD